MTEPRIIDNKDVWEQALSSATHVAPNASFLQSWEWGEFQKEIGHQPVRLLIENTIPVQVTLLNLPFKKQVAYIARPVQELQKEAVDAVVTFLQKEYPAVLFVRYEGTTAHQLDGRETTTRQPQTSLLLSLEKDAETLLQEMHSKTRYNIRLAERKGVEISEEKDPHIFWELNQETTARDKFSSHDESYYAAMIRCPLVRQYVARCEGEVLAAILCVQYGKTTWYLHGASSNRQRNAMAPYLLQWYAILEAQHAGCQYYDFWGIAPVVQESKGGTTFHGLTWQADHPWTGITRFKAGFGGAAVTYPDAVEIAVRPLQDKIFQLGKRLIWGGKK